MIYTLGTFAAIWLFLWVVLGLFALAAYPLLRNSLLDMHPRSGSALLLVYWTAPFVVSLSGTLFLFMPALESVLVNSHCHQDCSNHVPLIESTPLAMAGLTAGLLAVALVLVRFVSVLRRSRQLAEQFKFLAQERGSYHVIGSPRPLVFTLGWWRPAVYVSEGLAEACSETDMSIILSHEDAHRDRRDNLRLLLARLASAVSFGPTARRVMTDLQLLTEEACDFRAAERYGHVAVAETLLKVKRLLLADSPFPELALAFAERDVEARIIALLQAGGRRALHRWQLAALFGAVVLSVLVMITPLHHGSEWVITYITGETSHSH